jgi:hypothetical protein
LKRIIVGLVFGAVLGALDGATSWFTPEVRAMLIQIIMASMAKDAVVGVIAGVFALKVRTMAAGVGFAAVVGFGFAFLVAQMQHAHYAEILIPGTIVGALLGYATQKSGTTAVAARETH